MNRREFIRFTTLSALPILLEGCVPAGLHRKEPTPLGGSWLENARRAQAIFQAAASGKMTDANGIPFAVSPARDAWLAAGRTYENLVDPTFSQTYALAEAATMYTRAVNSLIRASTQKTARRLPPRREDNRIVIRPGEQVSYTEQGYCLDPTLPAPNRGELLRLVPTDSLIPEELLPLYKAVLRQAAREDSVGEQYRASLQYMIWAIRTAGQPNSPYMANPSPQIRQLFNDALPGGWELLLNYHLSRVRTAKLTSDLVNAVARGLKLNVNTRAEDFADHATANRIVDQQMQTLINTPVGGQVVPGSQHTEIADGVCTICTGAGPVIQNVTILNVSGTNHDFDPLNWASESQRPTQRIATVGRPRDLRREMTPVFSEDAWLEKFLPVFVQDFTKFRSEKFLANAFTPVGKLIAARDMAPELKTSIDFLPLVGNGLALYEAVSGKNWNTQEPLDDLDRALAIAGTIPGAAVLTKLGSKAANSVLRTVLRKAANSGLVRIADSTSEARDIIGWANSSSTQMILERVQNDPYFEQYFRVGRRLFDVIGQRVAAASGSKDRMRLPATP